MFNEVHSIHGHTLLLITKSSLQATALLQHLKQSLAITGKLHNIQRSLDDISSGSIIGNDSNLLIVFYVQIMPDDFVMQLHRF
ncbi:CsgBAC operon transcriptional regulatory protein [Escherichia coli KTE42]|nr:CsgBAC operon transcriptional regulatory protein [Escherichia coli KTE42]